MLDPEVYGAFTGIGVYLGYILLSHVGIINGLGREIPFQLGKGNAEYGQQLANSSFVVTTFLGVIAALVFLFFSVINFINGNTLIAITFLSYVIAAGLNLFNFQFLPVLYRTSADFSKLSKINITFGYFNLISVLFVWKFGFYGLLMRSIFLTLVQFYMLFKNKPYKLTFKVDIQHIKVLLRTGLPIYAVGQVNPLWTTIVNNLIFSMGGAKFFGLYALANIVQTSVNMIPQAFGQIIYPRMSIMYGQGKKPQEIIRLNMKPLVFQFLVMLFVAITGVFALPWVIPYLLPKYTGGIEAAQWIMFVPVIYSFGAINNIFNVTKQQRPYFISLLVGALAGTAYIYIFLSTGSFNLLIFPQGMILGKLIQQVLSLFFAFRLK
jgi:O-antigen/teichoic acid export membrane protein